MPDRANFRPTQTGVRDRPSAAAGAKPEGRRGPLEYIGLPVHVSLTLLPIPIRLGLGPILAPRIGIQYFPSQVIGFQSEYETLCTRFERRASRWGFELSRERAGKRAERGPA